MRLSKIYTKSGDQGKTSLIGGERVPKSDLRLEAYGTSDELNSQIGLIRTLCFELSDPNLSEFREQSLKDWSKIQNALFDIGSFLAVGEGGAVPIQKDEMDKQVEYLEERMDLMNENLPVLKSFTLPGGCMINAHAHVARTVCRRLERVCYRLHQETQSVEDCVMKYVNRLSDYLFVFSRFSSAQLGADEFLWERPLS